MSKEDLGGISGSRASTEPLRVSALPGFDPGRVAKEVREKDAYPIPYLLGWFGLAEPQPWGAAQSFALEIAKGYGLIASECDAHATPLDDAVAEILKGEGK